MKEKLYAWFLKEFEVFTSQSVAEDVLTDFVESFVEDVCLHYIFEPAYIETNKENQMIGDGTYHNIFYNTVEIVLDDMKKSGFNVGMIEDWYNS